MSFWLHPIIRRQNGVGQFKPVSSTLPGKDILEILYSDALQTNLLSNHVRLNQNKIVH